jgi:hypothetical protein
MWNMRSARASVYKFSLRSQGQKSEIASRKKGLSAQRND